MRKPPLSYTLYGAAALFAIWILTRDFDRPKWMEDLLLRTYAKDHLANGKQDPFAAKVAGDYGLPLRWVLILREYGATDAELPKLADRMLQEIAHLGPPKDAQPATLAAYKTHVIEKTLT